MKDHETNADGLGLAWAGHFLQENGPYPSVNQVIGAFAWEL